jgi:hypothetical protein
MKYFWLSCVCPDCGGLIKPRTFGITSDHQIVIAGKCSGCKREQKVLFPLSELFRDCTRRNESAIEPNRIIGEAEEKNLTPEDLDLLSDFGITFKDQ